MQQMCWLSNSSTSGQKILHLRIYSHKPWQPYTEFTQYAVPDYDIPGGSQGWATFHKLRLAGWVLLPTPNETDYTLDDDDRLAS